MDVRCFPSRLAGVAVHGVNQDRLSQHKEEAGDCQNDVEEHVDVAAEGGNVFRQPPSRDKRGDDEQEQGPAHHSTKEDAPEFLHETTPRLLNPPARWSRGQSPAYSAVLRARLGVLSVMRVGSLLSRWIP